MSITTKRGRTVVSLMAIAVAVALALPAPPQAGAGAPLPPGGTFVDDDGNTHEGMIEQMASSSITLGCEPALYCPEDSVTRGQMASFLARAFTLPPPSDDYFMDDDGSTHEDNINRIYEAGISTGFTDGTYRPGEIVSRAQMGSLLARALALTPVSAGPFVDVSGVHAGNINAIYEAGITTGCALGATYYCPTDPVRRDQMASFLGRSLSLTPLAVPARDWTLAVSALDTGDVPTGVHIVDGNTGATTSLTSDVDVNPQWNADKSRVAFHRLFADLFADPTLGEDFVPPVHVIEADGSAEYDIDTWLAAAGEPVGGSFNFSFGPDGRLAIDAGTSFAGTDRDLWIADVDGMSASELAADPAWWLTDPVWSAGGDYIAVYAGDGTGSEAIRVFDSGTGMEVVDIAEPANFFDFAWSPTAEVLVVHLASTPTQNELLLWDVAIGDGTPILLPGNAAIGGFAWSPDGTQIAYVSTVDGDYEVYVLDLATEMSTQLTFSDGIEEWAPVWSPDGTMLAFGELDGSTVHVVVAETGTEVATIAGAQDPDW